LQALPGAVLVTLLSVGTRSKIPNENQDFGEEKFKELDSDQIEGGEFEF